jgi:putative membrane protein
MLNAAESDVIEQAVAAAETQTRSEIMVCMLPASSEDRGIAGIIAMLSAGLVLLFLPGIWPEMDIWIQSALATVVGVAIFLAVDYFDLGLKLLPHGLTARHARRAARAHFLDCGLDATPERNAVLLFVSRAERYVEILPDRGLAAQVPQQRWVNIIARFQETARGRGMVEAIAEAVAAIGAVCAGPFPAGIDNPDLVSNRPVSE